MERYSISDERSFACLLRMSQTQNVKLRVIAAEVIANTDTARALASANVRRLASLAPKAEVDEVRLREVVDPADAMLSAHHASRGPR